MCHIPDLVINLDIVLVMTLVITLVIDMVVNPIIDWNNIHQGDTQIIVLNVDLGIVLDINRGLRLGNVVPINDYIDVKVDLIDNLVIIPDFALYPCLAYRLCLTY